jgi:Bacterial dnaA protein helix-turn-helix
MVEIVSTQHSDAYRSRRLEQPILASLGRNGGPAASRPIVIPAPLPAVPGRIAVGRVIDVTAEYFEMTPAELLAADRTPPLLRQRQIAMYVACQVTGRSLRFMGGRMGGRCHTTILRGVRAVQGLLDADDTETAAAVRAIREQLLTTVREPPVPAKGHGRLERPLRTGRA